MMIDRRIAEATECDFKVALEVKKPKSWLKSVSAFANGIGGTLFFGIDNDRNVVGLDDVQSDAEVISRLIKERITPFPSCANDIRFGQATAWRKNCSIPLIFETKTVS